MPFAFEVLLSFDTESSFHHESQYRSSYEKLLKSFVSSSRHIPRGPFFVVQHYEPREHYDNGPWVATYEIKDRRDHNILFFLVLTPAADLPSASKRAYVDDRIRQRLTELSSQCPLATMHAVSAIGTKLAFYSKVPGQEVTPQEVLGKHHAKTQDDVAPVERWSCDILEREGERRLRKIFEELYSTEGLAAPAEAELGILGYPPLLYLLFFLDELVNFLLVLRWRWRRAWSLGGADAYHIPGL